MSQRSKHPKLNKTVFTINTDRLHEDSSQQLFEKAFQPQSNLNLFGFEFPLNQELQEIHQSPEATQLSAYILHLENQLKSITNKIQFQYHQSRQTVLFLVQSTKISKHVTRKKIDQEFTKMGIVRKYQPNLKFHPDDVDQETLSKDAGDFAIDQIKSKIQVEWECQISDEMEKQRRRMRQLEKKRQKDLEQIDRDFQRLMKKRKTQRQMQAQVKSQQSIKQLQNMECQSNRTEKKIQKRQKINVKNSPKVQRNKKQQSVANSIYSQIDQCSLNKDESQSEQYNRNIQSLS